MVSPPSDGPIHHPGEVVPTPDLPQFVAELLNLRLSHFQLLQVCRSLTPPTVLIGLDAPTP